MVKIVAIALLSTLFFGTTAFAADAVDGTWKLNIAKSKFGGTAPKSATRVYTEGADGTTLDQKMVGADGKETSMHVTLAYDGKDHPITGNPDAARAGSHSSIGCLPDRAVWRSDRWDIFDPK